jgi:hypothetical protein
VPLHWVHVATGLARRATAKSPARSMVKPPASQLVLLTLT